MILKRFVGRALFTNVDPNRIHKRSINFFKELHQQKHRQLGLEGTETE